MSPRWLARATFVLVLVAADLIGFADLASLTMVAVGAFLIMNLRSGGGKVARPDGIHG